MRRATAPLTIFTIKVAVVPSGYAIEMNAKWSPIIGVRTGAERHCQNFSSFIHEWDHIVHRERICQAGQHSGHGRSIDAHELRDHIENRGEKF